MDNTLSSLQSQSINHTLLSYEVLTNKSIPIEGIIFNGQENKETEKYILKHTGLPCLLRVLEEEKVTKEMISKYAQEWGK
jgi:dethiobiotin synthetase